MALARCQRGDERVPIAEATIDGYAIDPCPAGDRFDGQRLQPMRGRFGQRTVEYPVRGPIIVNHWFETRDIGEELGERVGHGEQMRAYYARMRPVLAATEVAQQHVEHILNGADNLIGEPPWFARPLGPLVRTVFRKATISTLPHWMRRMAGVRQSRFTDMLVLAFLRPVFKLVHRSPRIALKLVDMSSPSTVRIVGPALFGVEPADTSAALPRQRHVLASASARPASSTPNNSRSAPPSRKRRHGTSNRSS